MTRLSEVSCLRERRHRLNRKSPIAFLILVMGCIVAACGGEKGVQPAGYEDQASSPQGSDTEVVVGTSHNAGEMIHQPTILDIGTGERTKFDATEPLKAQLDSKANCRDLSSLPPVQHPYYVSGPESTEDRFDLESREWIEPARSFASFVTRYYTSAEGQLTLELPAYEIRDEAEYRRLQEAKKLKLNSDRAELLSELSQSGYCNTGVSRELSVSGLAVGLANALAFSDYGYDGLALPSRFGSPWLYFAYHAPTDPLYDMVHQLEDSIIRTLRSSEAWNPLSWRFAGEFRYCSATVPTIDDLPLRELLNQLLGRRSANSSWSSRAIDAIEQSGYSVDAYEEEFLECIREFRYNLMERPYDPEAYVPYLSLITAEIVRQLLIDHENLIPPMLTIVD